MYTQQNMTVLFLFFSSLTYGAFCQIPVVHAQLYQAYQPIPSQEPMQKAKATKLTNSKTDSTATNAALPKLSSPPSSSASDIKNAPPQDSSKLISVTQVTPQTKKVLTLSSHPGPNEDTGKLKPAFDMWQNGDLDSASLTYRKLIETGGLSPKEVLEAYVKLASALFIMGKKDEALAAFRSAALIDVHFTLPEDAGQKVKNLASRAQSDMDGIGALDFSAHLPVQEAGVFDVFKVEIFLDAAHLAVVEKIKIRIYDPLSFKAEEQVASASERHIFSFSNTMFSQDRSLRIQVDALDKYGNRLASLADLLAVEQKNQKKSSSEGTSFWSTPWPYVIGGVLLASGGVASYFFFRPANKTDIGAPSF